MENLPGSPEVKKEYSGYVLEVKAGSSQRLQRIGVLE
jgi:hypothetical protein